MEESYSYNIIKGSSSAEIVVTKSKFIADLRPVSSVSEAEDMILSVRKKYNDARHNCYAYIVMEGDGIVKKSSDDGEPSGTAGRPMLSVMEGAGLVNAVCVVTRYFGGVLLGTGGLVRAYSDAVSEAMGKCEITPIRRGRYIETECDYADEGSVRRLFESMDYSIIESSYAEKVLMKVLGPEEKSDSLIGMLVDRTGGRASGKPGESTYY